MTDRPSPPRALLFDLGGVLVDIDFDRALAAWQPHSRLDEPTLRSRFGFDAAYLAHEEGRLDADGYFDHLRSHLELQASTETVRLGWNAIFCGEIADTVALVDDVRHRLPCHVLSNTNEIHLQEVARLYPHLLPRFEQVFASHRIGLRKPDPACFAHVLGQLGLAPGDVLFFDDLSANVAAARAFGLHAEVFTRPADLRAALLAHGLT